MVNYQLESDLHLCLQPVVILRADILTAQTTGVL